MGPVCGCGCTTRKAVCTGATRRPWVAAALISQYNMYRHVDIDVSYSPNKLTDMEPIKQAEHSGSSPPEERTKHVFVNCID